MSSLGNRYGALQDNEQEETEVYVNTQDGDEEVHFEEVGGTGKEGWEDDINLEHEADDISEESPTEHQDRRRKVSQGQPSPPVQTLLFPLIQQCLAMVLDVVVAFALSPWEGEASLP